MIPNKNTNNRVSHNLEGESFAMDIDPANAAFLMDSVTNLYKSPATAVLREYSTNARDSHIEAGIPDRPVEVTLPTRENPVLSIKDFGVGLDKADIDKTYRLFAASTKRGTNDLNGVLGLGSKSALAYTDQFTVVARKNGIKTTVAIIRKEGGGGKLVVVSEESISPDDTGVEVLIPANVTNKWQEKADKLYRFWPEGSVLVNGEKPKSLKGGINITENIVAYQRWGQAHAESVKLDADYIVMGNVGYPIWNEFSNYDTRLVIYVENGDVDFVPSREDLRDTEVTQTSLAAYKNEYRKGRDETYQAFINEAKNKPEAIERFLSYRWLNRQATITWNGEAIPTTFGGPLVQTGFVKHETKMRKIPEMGISNGKGKPTGMASIREHDGPAQIAEARGLWITGYQNANWGALNRERFEGFVNKLKMDGKLPQSARVAGAFITKAETIENGDWLDPRKVFTWAEVKKFKLPRAANGQPKVAGTYPIWSEGEHYTHETAVADIDTEKPLLFDDNDRKSERRLVAQFVPEVQVAVLSPNRVNKFRRLFPEAKSVRETLTEKALEWFKGLTQDDKDAIAYGGDEPFDLEYVNDIPEHLLDPDLRHLIALQEKNSREVDTRLKDYLPREEYDALENDEQQEAMNKLVEELSERYLLLIEGPYGNSITDTYKAHAVNYVNQAYIQHIQNKTPQCKEAE